MAGELGSISGEVVIDYDDRGLAKASSDTKDFANKTEDTGRRGSKAWGRIQGAVKLAIGAIAVERVVAWGQSIIQAAEESESITRGLAQVFESMGGTASDAFKGAADQAAELGQRIAVDDDEIAKIQTKLATFRGIWEDPVEGATNFGRATQLAFDLAAAGFGSADSNASSLGRALQDPTRGMTALSRSGVTFTEQEKEKIKALQESGDMLAAQEILYKAVEAQVSGTAEASVTDTQRMSLVVSELGESFGKLLLPAVKDVSKFIIRLTGWIDENKGTTIALVGTLAGLAAAVTAVSLATKVYSAATRVATAVQAAFNLVTRLNPLGLIITVIALVVAGIIYLATQTQFFQKLWTAVWGWVKDVAQDVWDFLVKAFNAIGDFISGSIQFWRTFITAGLKAIQTAWNTVWGAIMNFAMGLWNAVTGFISERINFVRNIIRAGIDFIRNFISEGFRRARQAIEQSVGFWVSLVRSGVDKVRAGINRVGEIVTMIRNFFGRARDAAADRISSLVALAKGLPGRVIRGIGNLGSRLFSAGRDLVMGLVNGIKNAAGAAVNAAREVVGNAVQGAKNLLGIGSPSRVFRDEVGQWIPKGLAQGIRSTSREPIREIERMTVALATAPTSARATMVPTVMNSAGPSYTFGPGSIVLDLSRLRSIEDVVNAVDRLKVTARQYVRG